MTGIKAQNCPRCGAEPVNMYDWLACPKCTDMYAVPAFDETPDDVVVKWNKLGIKRCTVQFNDKVYVDADMLLEWLDKKIEPHVMKCCMKDADGNIIEEYPDYIAHDGQIYGECMRRVERMKKGIRTVDGVES